MFQSGAAVTRAPAVAGMCGAQMTRQDIGNALKNVGATALASLKKEL